ncbi:MAG: hypothetical protein QOJ80_6441 [Mycobacterium sp.]|jgi:hypothetical protein|nr:hypothetical protein [Mycobacterium sp.]
MDPDDPEARIRELEVGSFSENPGIAPPPRPQPLPPPAQVPPPSYGAPPPPPYGTGFGSGTPFGAPIPTPTYSDNVRRSRIRRTGWGSRLIVLAVFGFFMFTPLWNAVHTLFAQWWPSSGHGSSTSAPLTVEKGGTLSVSGNNTSQTVACNDGTLTLGGNSNKFTVTGHCLTLHVSGNDTRVTVDSADTIDGGGIRTVTSYHSGTPKIVKTGIDVTVQQG